MMKTKKIFIIAGEQSGDNIGAGIISACQGQNIEFEGVVGDKMLLAGAKEFAHIKSLSVMGFTEVISKIFSILRLLKKVVTHIITTKPDIVITVDNQDFSMRVMKKCYPILKGKTKFYHVVAPTVWAYREYRAKALAQVCDHLFCLFPFEVDYFTKYGLKTTFIGHPIALENRDIDATPVANKYQLDANDKILVLMPGSRKQEVHKHWQFYLDTVNLLRKKIPGLKVFALIKEHLIPENKDGITIISDEGEKKAFFRLASVGLIKSGTSVIETAYYGLPTVVAYKVSAVTAFIIKMLIKVKFVSIINIMADKEVIPEFLQERATSENLANALYQLIKDPKPQLEQVARHINQLKSPNGELPGGIIASQIASLNQHN